MIPGSWQGNENMNQGYSPPSGEPSKKQLLIQNFSHEYIQKYCCI